MPPIRIAPGTFAGGTRFMDIAVPMAAQALAGMFQGKRLGEQETYERQQKADAIQREQAELQRKQAIADMSALIDIHGPDVVNQPQFRDRYRQLFGRDYPVMPVMKTEEVSPEVPAVPGTPDRIMTVPGTSPAERGPGGARPIEAPSDVVIPGREATAAKPAVTREVPTGETRPAPLGGIMANITPRQLGMEGLIPPKLLDVPLPELKKLGFDIDVLFRGGKAGTATSDSVVAQALQAFREGRATPGDMAVLQLKYADKAGGPPRTIQAYAVQKLQELGGDMNRLQKEDPFSHAVLVKEATTTGQKGVLFNVPGPGGQPIPVTGMDDLKTLIARGIVKIDQLPPIARNMLNLDKEGQEKGIPAGSTNSAITAAGNDAAKILGIFTISGTWAWQTDEFLPDGKTPNPERAKEIGRWEALRDKFYRERINRMRTEMGTSSIPGAPAVSGNDPDDPSGAGPIQLHSSLQYLTNTKTIGKYTYEVTSTTSDQHAKGSNHYKGRAIDVVPSIPINQWDAVIREFEKNGYKVIDERTQKSKEWTGAHLHVEPGPQLMRQGKPLDASTRKQLAEAVGLGVQWSQVEQTLRSQGYSANAIQDARKIFDGMAKLKPTKSNQAPATNKPKFGPSNTLFNITRTPR